MTRWFGLAVIISMLIAACGTETIVETVEVPVERTVEVVVEKTVEVPVEVEKAVEVTVEVEKEVIQTVVVAPELGGPVRDKDTLVVAVHKAAPTLDPLIDSVNYFETDQVFDFLIAQDADLNPIPGLATEWERIDDVTYIFKLREGVTFHNGEEFTCEDVRFSLDHMKDPETQSRRWTVWFNRVQEYECVDDFTLQLTTTSPAPSFIYDFAKLQVVPADTYQEMGGDQFGVAPVGTGPYKLIEWVQGSHATFEVNEDYWAGVPPIKNLEIRIVVEPATRVALLLSGEVDWIFEVPTSEADIIKQIPGFGVSIGPTTNMMFVGMNAFKEPFTDVRVRQAMNYAVDWDTIIETVLDGYAYRNASSAGSKLVGYDPDLAPYPYDPDKARELLAEAGYPDGFEALFDGPVGRYVRDREVAEAVAGYLNEVGITTQMNLNEWGTFWSRFLGLEIPGFYLLGCGGSSDFDLCNRLHFHSQVRGIYYNSPEVDALLDDESTTMDPEERLEKIYALLAKIQDEAPWIFGYDSPVIVANRTGLAQEVRPDLIAFFKTFSWEQ
jgi:peptide/nickel transport system substrate-binding protein